MCFSGTGNMFCGHIHLAVVYQNMTIQSHCSECLVISETLWTKWIKIYISKWYSFSCSEPPIFIECLNVILYSISIHCPTERSTMITWFHIMQNTDFATNPVTTGSTTASSRKSSALILMIWEYILFTVTFSQCLTILSDSHLKFSTFSFQPLGFCLCYLKELYINSRVPLICIIVGQGKRVTKLH